MGGITRIIQHLFIRIPDLNAEVMQLEMKERSRGRKSDGKSYTREATIFNGSLCRLINFKPQGNFEILPRHATIHTNLATGPLSQKIIGLIIATIAYGFVVLSALACFLISFKTGITATIFWAGVLFFGRQLAQKVNRETDEIRDKLVLAGFPKERMDELVVKGDVHSEANLRTLELYLKTSDQCPKFTFTFEHRGDDLYIYLHDLKLKRDWISLPFRNGGGGLLEQDLHFVLRLLGFVRLQSQDVFTKGTG